MKNIFLLVIISLSQFAVSAQSSMMDDVSPAYLDRLIEAGKANYPKFRYTKAKTNSAKASYDKTKLGVLDFATVGYVYSPGSYSVIDNRGGYNSFLNGYQVSLFLNVGSILQKPAVIKGAKQDYIAAKADEDLVDMNVVQEIKKRYYIYIQQKNILKLKSKGFADADDMLKHTKYRFEKGETSYETYNQSLTTYSTYSLEKINAEASLLIAKANLEEIIGTSLESIK